MSNFRLALYYFESCPYCQLVLSAIDRLQVKIKMCDIQSNPENLSRLVKDTGRKTVPCLYIDEKPMHESTEIIRWIEANAVKQKGH